MGTLHTSITLALDELRIPATDHQTAQLVSYVNELERWNRIVNLTGKDNKEEMVRDLVADALFLHTTLPVGKKILDLGSGSGVLAIPLSVLDPESRVFSVDKSLRKIQFQRHVKRLLGLHQLGLFHARAEDLPVLDCDILVAKAFGAVRLILTLAERHLARHGRAFLVRGATEKAAEEEGFLLERCSPYSPIKGGKTYQLFVYKKVT
jgi:16S rRNA (guanine527-N7)-methyltransferase